MFWLINHRLVWSSTLHIISSNLENSQLLVRLIPAGPRDFLPLIDPLKLGQKVNNSFRSGLDKNGWNKIFQMRNQFELVNGKPNGKPMLTEWELLMIVVEPNLNPENEDKLRDLRTGQFLMMICLLQPKGQFCEIIKMIHFRAF